MKHSSTLINKFRSSNDAQTFSGSTSAKQNDYPIHQLQENEGVNWIVIDGNIVHDTTNSYFEQIKQPNGDIYLKKIDIF